MVWPKQSFWSIGRIGLQDLPATDSSAEERSPAVKILQYYLNLSSALKTDAGETFRPSRAPGELTEMQLQRITCAYPCTVNGAIACPVLARTIAPIETRSYCSVPAANASALLRLTLLLHYVGIHERLQGNLRLLTIQTPRSWPLLAQGAVDSDFRLAIHTGLTQPIQRHRPSHASSAR